MSSSMDQLTVLPACGEAVGIVRQESSFVVVDKPTRLLTVPGRHPANRDSVIARLRETYPDVHAVHRLDFDTSGLLVIPLTKASLSNLSRQFQARTVKKTYTAVVHGWVLEDRGVMEWPIAPDPERRPRSKVAEDGKPALTHYRVLSRDSGRNTTRLALFPVTGRSHQLRLHCAELGHPILGCEFYAPEAVRQQAPRLLLHASTLSFAHPESGEAVSYESVVPF
ncbi:RluA family pseudouridine synthase [Marinimicrobium sp. C6131]|uniref:RluA family pseudouridine synthase n=1 Tax=Marinimicrobium sp. C6131 TaxID=3022676 RepID=UPI00223E08D6|nr:RluA family pseudouridine synthase [Marinimicrobium sp. C6131]UZJ45680.1 RluA family pseudouridine synthase [Marinimicrobium sp. C6131]